MDGWSTARRLLDSLGRSDGPPADARLRPVHTFGVGASGTFAASDIAANYCAAAQFRTGGTVPVTLRFSNGSGCGVQHDGWSDLRGLAVRFHLGTGDNGEEAASDLLAMTLPEFFAPSVETFLDFAVAARPQPYVRQSPWRKFVTLLNLEPPRRDPYPGETVSPDPGAQAFANAHDFAQLAVFQDATIGTPVSFVRAAYHAVHTFILTSADGVRRCGCFVWQPTLGVLNTDPALPPENLFLADELRTRLTAGPASFTLMLTLGEVGDRLEDATKASPVQRRRVFMGTLTVDRVAEDQLTGCERLSFNPCRVAPGIELSDDPILRARGDVYDLSQQRRGVAPCPFAGG